MKAVFPGHAISCIEMPLGPLAHRTLQYVINFYGLLEINGLHKQTPDHPGVEVIFQNETTSTPLIMLEQNIKVRVHPIYAQHPVKSERIIEMLTFSMFVPNKLTGFKPDYREFTVCTNINISIQQNRCKQ